MKTKIVMIALFIFSGMYGASAQQHIKAHQKVQKHRVKSGVQSGEITKGEKKVVQYRQHEIRQDAKLAKADGKVTAPEKKMIRKEQKKNSKIIHRVKHNGRTRS